MVRKKDYRKVSLCIEGVDLNFVNRVHWDIKHVSLCIEGVDLNTDPQVLSAADGCLPLHRGSGFKLLCILQEMVINSVSLCIEGVDLNLLILSNPLYFIGLPLHRGSGFKLIFHILLCEHLRLPLHRGSGFKQYSG